MSIYIKKKRKALLVHYYFKFDSNLAWKHVPVVPSLGG